MEIQDVWENVFLVCWFVLVAFAYSVLNHLVTAAEAEAVRVLVCACGCGVCLRVWGGLSPLFSPSVLGLLPLPPSPGLVLGWRPGPCVPLGGLVALGAASWGWAALALGGARSRPSSPPPLAPICLFLLPLYGCDANIGILVFTMLLAGINIPCLVSIPGGGGGFFLSPCRSSTWHS